jgi:hypothetical protein
MAVNTVEPLRNGTTEVTDRFLSPAIWAEFPRAEVVEDPSRGLFFFDDFVATPDVAAGAEANYGIYKGFASTGGSVAEVAGVAGGQKVFSSDGDNEGASLATVSKPVIINRSAKMTCFEARVKFSTIADTNSGAFVGLIDTSTLSATVPIAAAGTLADENFVGFHRLEGDGDKLDIVYKADGVTQVTLLADAVTLVADTWVKIGFRFEQTHSAGNFILRFFANNVELTPTNGRYQIPTAQGTDFPNDVAMGLVAAILNATGTSPGTMTVDWWALGQMFDF